MNKNLKRCELWIQQRDAIKAVAKAGRFGVADLHRPGEAGQRSNGCPVGQIGGRFDSVVVSRISGQSETERTVRAIEGEGREGPRLKHRQGRGGADLRLASVVHKHPIRAGGVGSDRADDQFSRARAGDVHPVGRCRGQLLPLVRYGLGTSGLSRHVKFCGAADERGLVDWLGKDQRSRTRKGLQTRQWRRRNKRRAATAAENLKYE